MYRFRPWIGENYQQGRWGKRVLVLGESHYQWDENMPIDNWPTLTIECVEEIISGHAQGRWQAFWTKVAVASLGHTSTLDEKRTFWHSVAFYNYIQHCVGFGPYARPTPEI